MIQEVINMYADEERAEGPRHRRGAKYFRNRVQLITDWAARHQGDVAEIGASVGHTTVQLAAVACRHDRRVLVVDPWKPGTQNCSGQEYDEFMDRTRAYHDIMDIVRVPSQTQEAIDALSRQLCFAWVDGLHTADAVESDIRAVAHCPVIAVDDIKWSKPLRDKFFALAEEMGRSTIWDSRCREGYIL